MELIRKEGRPYISVGPNIEIPLVMNAAQQIGNILAVKNEKINDKFKDIVNYIIDERNFEHIDYSIVAANGLYEVLVNGAQHLGETEYDILSHISSDNIFGFVKHCPVRCKDMLELYIMNDVTPKMLAHKAKDPNSFKSFGIYEEDFMSVAEPFFRNTKAYFGGHNIARKIPKEGFIKCYIPGGVSLDDVMRNPHKTSEEDFLFLSKSQYHSISMTPIEEVFASYNPSSNSIITIEDGIVIESLNRPFDIFEDKNLATIYTFAGYERFRYKYGINPSYKFMNYGDMNIDWDPNKSFYFNEENSMRFTVNNGKIYDNKLKSEIPLDHATNMLNLFEDQLEELSNKHTKVAGQMELFNASDYCRV